jgi:hypothetical protein
MPTMAASFARSVTKKGNGLTHGSHRTATAHYKSEADTRVRLTSGWVRGAHELLANRWATGVSTLIRSWAARGGGGGGQWAEMRYRGPGRCSLFILFYFLFFLFSCFSNLDFKLESIFV